MTCWPTFPSQRERDRSWYQAISLVQHPTQGMRSGYFVPHFADGNTLLGHIKSIRNENGCAALPRLLHTALVERVHTIISIAIVSVRGRVAHALLDEFPEPVVEMSGKLPVASLRAAGCIPQATQRVHQFRRIGLRALDNGRPLRGSSPGRHRALRRAARPAKNDSSWSDWGAFASRGRMA